MVVMDVTVGCGRPQRCPQKCPQQRISRISFSGTARAVKAGEAEAPTCRRRAFTARTCVNGHNGIGRPPRAGLEAPLPSFRVLRSPRRDPAPDWRAASHSSASVWAPILGIDASVSSGPKVRAASRGSGLDWVGERPGCVAFTPPFDSRWADGCSCCRAQP